GAFDRLDADLDGALILIFPRLLQALAAGDNPRQYLDIVQRGPYLLARRIDGVVAGDLHAALLSTNQADREALGQGKMLSRHAHALGGACRTVSSATGHLRPQWIVCDRTTSKDLYKRRLNASHGTH